MPKPKTQLGVIAALLTTLLGFSIAYLLGESTQESEAVLATRKAPDADQRLEEARGFQKVKKWAKANHLLRVLADEGHPVAMYHLARAHKYGWGVDADLETARDWLMEAVRYDYVYRGETAYEIGRLYQMSIGKDCDAIAVEWFEKALTWDFKKAHVQLAYHYRYGLGTDKDVERSLYHYEQAAIAGYPTSTIKYAQWLLKGGSGIRPDDEKAQYWGRRAANGLVMKANDGSASASKTLGRLYRDGVFVKMDLFESERWFRRSARLGDAGGMHELALLLLRDTEDEDRPKEAVEWLQMAAELGHGGALTDLGRLHLKQSYGLSEAEAVGLFERGVLLRHPGSMAELAQLLAEGRLVETDRARALKLSRDGAKLGHKGAQSLLSELEAQAQHSPIETDKS
jgi:TPR repeat protein